MSDMLCLLKVGKVLAQLVLPVAGHEARRANLGEVEVGVDGARGHGVGSACVVLGGSHGRNGVTITACELKDPSSDLCPGGHATGSGEVVGAVRGTGVEKREDSLSHLVGEGKTAQLVVHHGHVFQAIRRIGTATRQAGHCANEVIAVADDPTRAHHVVRSAARHCQVAGGLGLPIDT